MEKFLSFTNDCDIGFCSVPSKMRSFSNTNHIESCAHYDNKGKDLGIGEPILNKRGPTYTERKKKYKNRVNIFLPFLKISLGFTCNNLRNIESKDTKQQSISRRLLEDHIPERMVWSSIMQMLETGKMKNNN